MTCPICKKPSLASYRPFCSKRCANVDLGKWLNGAYVAQSQIEDEDADVAAALLERAEKPH